MATARLTGNVTTNVTSFADVTGLGFTLQANTDYYFRYVLHHNSGATTVGIRFAVNGPATPTALRVGGIVPISTVAANYGSQTAYDTAIFASTTATTVTTMSIIEGVIRVGASATGDLIPRVASEVGTSTVTVYANSHGVVLPLT